MYRLIWHINLTVVIEKLYRWEESKRRKPLGKMAFIVDTGEQIVPVEVKAKSMKTYREKYSSEISVRASMADYKKEDGLVNLPLYAVEEICRVQ